MVSGKREKVSYILKCIEVSVYVADKARLEVKKETREVWDFKRTVLEYLSTKSPPFMRTVAAQQIESDFLPSSRVAILGTVNIYPVPNKTKSSTVLSYAGLTLLFIVTE